MQLEKDTWKEITFHLPLPGKPKRITPLRSLGPQKQKMVFPRYGANRRCEAKTLAVVYLDDFSVTGDSCYSIDFGKQRKEFGQITPFAMDHGAWELEEDRLCLMCYEDAFAYAEPQPNIPYAKVSSLTFSSSFPFTERESSAPLAHASTS